MSAKTGPPVFLIAGDADPILDYHQSTEMHQALQQAGEPNALHIVPGGLHGHFTADQQVQIYGEILDFLRTNGVSPLP